MEGVPKIDWRDDDQPRGERFGRSPRRRLPFSGGGRVIRSWDFGAPPPVLEPRGQAATRRPLHLIWGPPVPRTP
jgi:hypothetical protein